MSTYRSYNRRGGFMFKSLMLCMAIVLVPGMTRGQVIVGIGGPSSSVKPVVQALVVDSFGRTVGSAAPFLVGIPVNVMIEVDGRVFAMSVAKSGFLATAGLLFS